jgi:lipid II isoglutaminyl synthase (glutamine-hydrolysing)
MDTLTAKLALARGLAVVSRSGGHGGTSAPGKLLMRLEPDAITALSRRLRRGSALISATNGKTTTAAIAASIFARAGIPLVHNRAGANMAGGIASSLVEAARLGSRMHGELGLFEVDEAWLPSLVGQLRPRAIVLGNLFRDQLDRYGELDAIAEGWTSALAGEGAHEASLVLNADDPLIADLPRAGTPDPAPAAHPQCVYFGVEDPSLALPGMSHAADAKHCRRCGAPYVFEVVLLGHLGHYHCPSCGQHRPVPSISASEVTLEGVRGARFLLSTPAGREHVELGLPGLYNVYNALAAAALASTLEVPLHHIIAGLRDSQPAFGRAETLMIAAGPRARPGRRARSPEPEDALEATGQGQEQRELRIMLVKNPAGANEVLRTLALEPGPHDVLGILNDGVADGRDVSWIWDADFELLAGLLGSFTCSGRRAAELALRLKYAGVPVDRITVEPDLERAVALAAGGPRSGEGPLYALPTYTAMLALRELLVRRGEADSAWA